MLGVSIILNIIFSLPNCYKFRIKLSVTFFEVGATFILFNRKAEKLISFLNQNDWDMEVITSQVQNLCYRTFVFKITVTRFNLKEGLANNTIMKLFELGETLEEQFKNQTPNKVINLF